MLCITSTRIGSREMACTDIALAIFEANSASHFLYWDIKV